MLRVRKAQTEVVQFLHQQAVENLDPAEFRQYALGLSCVEPNSCLSLEACSLQPAEHTPLGQNIEERK